MTRVFLAAGVAAMAIAAPASAKPDKDRHSGAHAAQVQRGGGTERAQRPQRATVQRAERPQRMAAQRTERPQRMSMQRAERPQRAAQRAERPDKANRVERAQTRSAQRQQVRPNRVERTERVAARQAKPNRVERVQNVQRNRVAERNIVQGGRMANMQDRKILRDQMRGERQNLQIARQDMRASNFAARNANIGVIAPRIEVQRFVGAPITTAAAQFGAFSAFPRSVQYLYPDTNDYYYRYGDGYAYRVNRDTNLISMLLPLLAGGYMPGQYLPANYMNNYVPNNYGFNSFYPDSQYNCNRYANGVVYQVDCASGYVEDVIPLYASGYGVGQMLPSSYGYYNVPSQYRSLYYNTSDANYWYAPGAIYQYDPSSSLITSVAALLSPGFGIGQPLPTGYGMYNVPMAYRSTYYDTPDAWYRYNNGSIYQVDPATQLVTALVASILT